MMMVTLALIYVVKIYLRTQNYNSNLKSSNLHSTTSTIRETIHNLINIETTGFSKEVLYPSLIGEVIASSNYIFNWFSDAPV